MENACTHGHNISYDLQIFFKEFKLINYHHDNARWFRQQEKTRIPCRRMSTLRGHYQRGFWKEKEMSFVVISKYILLLIKQLFLCEGKSNEFPQTSNYWQNSMSKRVRPNWSKFHPGLPGLTFRGIVSLIGTPHFWFFSKFNSNIEHKKVASVAQLCCTRY